MAEPSLPVPPGRTGGIHPALARRLAALHAAHPIRVNSGYRTMENQQLFFDCAQAKIATGTCPSGCEQSACASAARPGESNHGYTPNGVAKALAADIESLSGDTAGMHAASAELGLHFPIAHEPWHVQPVEVPTGSFTGAPFPPEDDLQSDEREAVLFVKVFLHELKDSGWFVGDILDRISSMERRLSPLR